MLQIKSDIQRHNIILLNQAYEDLLLSIKFIELVKSGINMNIVTYRFPNIIHIEDASEYELVGS